MDIKETYDYVVTIDLITHNGNIISDSKEILNKITEQDYFQSLDELLNHYITNNVSISNIEFDFNPRGETYNIDIGICDTNILISYEIGVRAVDYRNCLLFEAYINNRLKILKRMNTIDNLLNIDK